MKNTECMIDGKLHEHIFVFKIRGIDLDFILAISIVII